jgi:S-adenosylmethionine synthetase
MAFQPDGRLVLGGSFGRCGATICTNLARLDATGASERFFQPEAGTTYALAIQPDGKIVIGGQFSRAGSMISRCIARFNPDGSVDASFAPSPGAMGRL